MTTPLDDRTFVEAGVYDALISSINKYSVINPNANRFGNLVNRLFRRQLISPLSNFYDTIEGVNSLDLVDILIGVEEKFNIEIPDSNLSNIFGEDFENLYRLNVPLFVNNAVDYIVERSQ